MLWAIMGDFGSGKTLFLVLKAFDSNREVLGNFTLELPDYTPKYTKIDPIDLNYMGFNKMVLLDELQLWINSRVSGSFRNIYFSNIVNLSGHRTIDVYGSLHRFMGVDIEFRENVNRLVYCSRIGKEPEDLKRTEDYRDFRIEIMNTFTGRVKRKRLRYNIAEQYFKYYDTFEMLYAPNQEALEYELMIQDPEKYNKEISKRVVNIAEVIKPHLEKVTKASVTMGMLHYGFSKTYLDEVYSYLKGDFLLNPNPDLGIIKT